ncbi:MAG: ribonuclease [Patescibacteria group bacterium]|nr:ribonuclease [Patescibacteria group bacterium]
MQKYYKPQNNLVSTKKTFISELKSGDYRIINLGGTEECGKNMTIIEHEKSIIIINAGAQFSAASMPGVDYIIPNIKYLEERKDKIKGIIFTSATLEYSGAFPFINEKIDFPNVYARHYTNTILKIRSDNKDIDYQNEFVPIEEDMDLDIGDFKVRFFNTEQSTPDSLNISIKTKEGNIVYLSDTSLTGDEQLNMFDDGNKTLCLLADSLNTEVGGDSFKLSQIKDELKKVFAKAANKIFVMTFANNVYHITKILELAREMNKKIILDSQSISDIIAAAQEVGLIGNISDIVISLDDQNKYNSKDLIYFITGEEGREMDNMEKILEAGHNGIKIENGDIVIMATHPIIHNQRAAQNLKDLISRAGAKIIHYKYDQILISQSGTSEDLNKIHRKLLPKFFIPVAGCHYMLRVHADMERKIGTPENHIIIPDNGMLIEIRDDAQRIANTREKTDTETVVVDGNKIGKLHNVVLKDREILGEQGVFFVISLIDMRGHKLKKSPDLATRGFVFLKESQELLVGARDMSKDIIEEYLSKNHHIEIEDIKSILQNQISKYLLQKTAKQPVVIPIIIRV